MLEISKEYIDRIKEYLEEENEQAIKQILKTNHPADTAQTILHLGTRYARQLFSYLDNANAVDVLVELEEDIQKMLLEDYESSEIVSKFIEEMDSDDAADIINELPNELKEDIVSILHKSEDENIQDVIKLLDYEEDTAGGLMAQELVKVNINATVSECINEIQGRTEEVENVYAVYVIDNQGVLKGIIPLQDLVLHTPKTKIEDIYSEKVIYVDVHTEGEDIANKMQKYDLVVLPVIDEEGRLVGRITIDDVLDFIKEEAEEDYQLMSGITEDVDPQDKIWILSRARLPWLILGVVGGIAASMVIGQYEESIKIYPEMAFFIPIITAMAGNAGIQSSALVVQALAGNTFVPGNFIRKIFKEFTVSLINGLICGLLLFGYGVIFTDALGTALTISISLLSVIVLASTMGITIPLVLNKLKIDPALATGPFITTTNDLIGLAVYFYIGHLMYSITM